MRLWPGATSLALTRKLLMMTIIFLSTRCEAGDEMRSLATSMWEIVGGGGEDDGSEAKKPRL